MKMIVGGDLAVTSDFDKSLNFDDNLKSYFNSVDFRVLNLEGPVSNLGDSEKIKKTGPNLKLSVAGTDQVVESLKVDMVTLANNHIMDYGIVGFNDTIKYLDERGIEFVGAGKNILNSKRCKRIEMNELSVSIINIAENEWSSSKIDGPGAYPMDIIDNSRLISDENEKSDYVIVIVHGGHEHYSLPSHRMKDRLRFMVDHGADLVIMHHSHCISGSEVYRNKRIYYGIGNFLFTKKSKYKHWYSGIVVEIEVEKNKEMVSRPHFIKMDENDFSISLIRFEDGEELKSNYENLSDVIIDDKKLHDSYRRFINSKAKYYSKIWSGYSFVSNMFVWRFLNVLGLSLITHDSVMKFLNHMRSESHRELSIEILEEIYENNEA